MISILSLVLSFDLVLYFFARVDGGGVEEVGRFVLSSFGGGVKVESVPGHATYLFVLVMFMG